MAYKELWFSKQFPFLKMLGGEIWFHVFLVIIYLTPNLKLHKEFVAASPLMFNYRNGFCSFSTLR